MKENTIIHSIESKISWFPENMENFLIPEKKEDIGKEIERINKKEFRVECDNGQVVKANVASRFRTNQGWRRAKIVEGDRVVVEIIVAEPDKGDIVSLVDEN